MGHKETAILRIDGSRTEAGGFRLVYKNQDIVLSAVAFKTWLRVLLSRVGDPTKTLPVVSSSRDIHSLKYALGRQRVMQVFEFAPDDIEFDWDALAEVEDDKIAHVLAELKAAITIEYPESANGYPPESSE